VIVENCSDFSKLISVTESWMRKLMNVDMVRVSLIRNDEIMQLDPNGKVVVFPRDLGITGMTLSTGQVYMA
jgi:hypothetical protein